MYIRFSKKLDFFLFTMFRDNHFSFTLRTALGAKTFYGKDYAVTWMGVHIVFSRVGKTFTSNRALQETVSRDAVADYSVFPVRCE